MNYGLIYGIYACIIVAAIGVTSCVKLIVKRVAKENIGTLWEYLLSIISFVLAAGGSFLWLYFYGQFTSAGYYCVMCLLAGTSTYIIYLLLFQSTRKAGLALIKAITSRVTGKEFTDAIASTAKTGEATAETVATVTETLTGTDRINKVLELYGEDTSEDTEEDT